MTHRGLDNAYGDLAERRQKMDSKYDNDVEKIHVAFLEANSGDKFTGNFQEWLKSGAVLCKSLNALQPGIIKKVNDSSLPFKQMENISNFLTALPTFGVRVEDCFQTSDLFEGTNMASVQVCIESVRRIADMKKKGIKVEAQAPTRKQIKLPDGAKKLGEAAKPANSSASLPASLNSPAPKYTAEKSESGQYGDLVDRKNKLAAKYDKDLEASIKKWIEGKTGEAIGDDFQAGLRDGQILCKLMNVLKPGTIKNINSSKMAFKQMENINFFLDACKGTGIRTDDLFQTVALYEGENMTQVLVTLDNLKRITS